MQSGQLVIRVAQELNIKASNYKCLEGDIKTVDKKSININQLLVGVFIEKKKKIK